MMTQFGKRRGIVLAGGHGTRLYPLTKAVNKHLLAVGSKPMIYYPLTTLMLSGIREFLIISTPQATPQIEDLLEDGSKWGISIHYAVQAEPKGLPEAFLIAEDFINKEPVGLCLGDNVFHGQGLSEQLEKAASIADKATIFAYAVRNPESYGVVTLNAKGGIVNLEEKPQNPQSNLAVPGLYFFPGNVVDIARELSPSPRGELEITDLIQHYINDNKINVSLLSRGIAWFDAGVPRSLLDSSMYIDAIESRQGIGVACPEEVAFNMGFIDKEQLHRLIYPIKSTPYGEILSHTFGLRRR